MEILGKWGTYLFVPQVVLGIMVYVVTTYGGVDDVIAIDFALAAAGIVAVSFTAVAVVSRKMVGIAIASSSLAVVLAVFCALADANLFVWFFSFIGFVAATIAALFVKSEGAPEPLHLLVLASLPVLGAFMFLNLKLDEERERMMRR